MQILIHVLYNFPTLPLLRMRSVCHRFQDLVLRIVHSRLLLAASLDDRKLILECYHPSAQYSEPYLYCDYLGTPGLSDRIPGQGSIFEGLDHGGAGQVLQRLYSRFKPTRKDSQISHKPPRSAVNVPGSRADDVAESATKSGGASEPVKRLVNLDAHENFSQLVFNTDLVQLGPRRGVFLDIMSVNKKKTLRIFREWLAQRAQASRLSGEEVNGQESSVHPGDQGEKSEIVWIDEGRRSAGMYLRVEERKLRWENPLLLHRDEDQAVTYSLELQGKSNPECFVMGY